MDVAKDCVSILIYADSSCGIIEALVNINRFKLIDKFMVGNVKLF